MNFFIAYLKGIWLAVRKIKMWVLLYFINLLFALLVAIPLYNLLGDKTGSSLAMERMLPDFDYPVYQDFMNEYGDEFSVIMGQSRLIFAFYFFLSIFLVGGILNIFKNHKDKFSFQAFWSGCTVYFWRMLRLTVYFLIVHALVLALFSSLIYFGWFHDGLDGVESEVEMVNAVKIIVPIYLIIASFFFMVQDYAKIHVVHKNPNWLFFPFWQSFGIVFKNFLKTYPLYLLNALTFALVFISFWYFRFSNNMDSVATLALTFALGQTFIFSRIGIKMLNLGSATLMYQSIMEKIPVDEAITQDEIPENSIAEDVPDEVPPPAQKEGEAE